MTYQKTLFSGLIGFSLLAFGACSSASSTASASEDLALSAKAEQTQTDYLKPGAAIQFSHNYDGKTNPGEVENFQVFVKGGSLSGSLDIKMENNDGLTIYNDRKIQKFDVADDAPDGLDQAMNISVGAQNPGRYYLNFLASSDQGGDTPMMRAYTIAIQVGDQPYVPELGKGMTLEETPTGEKVISMEAAETIKN